MLDQIVLGLLPAVIIPQLLKWVSQGVQAVSLKGDFKMRNTQHVCMLQAIESKAGRSFYVAHSYLATSKHIEAHALFARSAQHAKAAVRQHQVKQKECSCHIAAKFK